jgi:hypothetical protein
MSYLQQYEKEDSQTKEEAQFKKTQLDIIIYLYKNNLYYYLSTIIKNV